MRRFWILLLFAIVLVSASAACGGDDDSAATQNPCGNGPTNCNPAATGSTVKGALLFSNETKTGATLGKSDAPITIELWFSLRCPHCHEFLYDALPQIVSTYVDTGKIKLTLRDAAFDDAAVMAHSALECANDQGRYWEAFDALNFHYTESDEDYSRDNINAKLDGAAVDLTALDACLDANTHKAAIVADADEIKTTSFNLLPVLKDGSAFKDSLETFADAKEFIDAHLSP